MAKYRQLYTEFWNDGFVMDLTPEEKFFYLYLMTNSKTSQCGIYELPKQIVVTETGYNRETVDKLLSRFCEYNKIIYCDETKEIMILNWIKYNEPNNINAIKCVNKEINKVKNSKFIEILYQQCVRQELEVDKIFEGLCRDLQGAYNGLSSNKVISNKEEIISNKQKEIINKEEVVSTKNTSASDLESVIKVFENNIHTMTSLEYKKLMEFTKEVSCEVIIMAIEEAVNYNARTIKYIAKILNCWISRGIKTADGVHACRKEWDNKKSSSQSENRKKSTFCDYEQRQYDFDELEKKLLGWSLPQQGGS
ncbi:DnaD domain protein [Clostridium sp. CS001]|uniref:DnaD domain-containing protein n=1 Tax=Clostridium sp. CS001 TaxID=2880648 RepID=UPI001CF583B5|nr:DnaD domain protein [Clostridium sp. CS001]MCB2291030.1 DnaD domain protein [Clostridium sp. CS001]